MVHVRKRILLCGPGLIGRVHARIIEECPGSELSAVVAPGSERNRRFAADYGVAFFEDLSSALDAQSFDGVVISSPNNCHFQQTMECLTRGVPVLVEKPITEATDEARLICEAVDEFQGKLLVGHHRTYSALVDTVMKFLKSSHFGNLVALQGSALFYKPTQYFKDGPWRTKSGGGPILINLIHEIGLMRTFAGEVNSVAALSSSAVRGFEVEDTVAISLRFESGALGTFILSDTAASAKSWELTSAENATYPNYSGVSCYHLAGTIGSIDFPTMRTMSYARQEEQSWWVPFVEGSLERTQRDPLVAQFRHFLDVIDGKSLPIVSAHDGYRNMQVLEAVRLSILSGSAQVVV